MTTIKKLKKWDGFDFERNKTFEKPLREGTDSSDEAKEFMRDFKSFLKKELAPYGITVINRKPNYYDVTEVVTNGTKFAYISLSDIRYNSCFGKNILDNVLYRTMEHEKDWTGGRNCYCHVDDLVSNIVNLLS